MSVAKLHQVITFDPYCEAQPSSAQIDPSLRRPRLTKETYNARWTVLAEKISIALQIIGLIGAISAAFIPTALLTSVCMPVLWVTAGCVLAGTLGARIAFIWSGYSTLAFSTNSEIKQVARITEAVMYVFNCMSSCLATATLLTASVGLWGLATPLITIPLAVFGAAGTAFFAVLTRRELADLEKPPTKQATTV